MNHNLKSLYELCIRNGYIKKTIDYKTFSTVAREFHKEISEKVLRGYEFRPAENLGVFHIIKDIRRGKTINWGESNKRKAEIIASGRIPYDKEKAPDGIYYLIYFEDNEYFKWKWFKEKPTQFIRNVKFYLFKPCTYNRRTISKVIKADNLIKENYGVYR